MATTQRRGLCYPREEVGSALYDLLQALAVLTCTDMSSQLKEDVDLAIQGLKGVVYSMLKRQEQKQWKHCDYDDDEEEEDLREQYRRRKRRVDRILQHMHHCLLEQLLKQESLRVGLQCLTETIWPKVLKELKSVLQQSTTKSGWKTAITTILQHFFSQLLRLHDGLILLVSGECRHEGDVTISKKQAKHLRSMLAGAATSSADQSGGTDADEGLADSDRNMHTAIRADGYTKLYNASLVYSGTGWDEFMDPHNGLQKRLISELQPHKRHRNSSISWDSLVEKMGGQAIEAILSRIEVQMQTTQQEFTTFIKHTMKQNLTRVLITSLPKVNVILSMADKLERLKVTSPSYSCQLDRLANNFQIRDEEGVLPSRYKRNEWLQALDLPAISVSDANESQNAYEAKRKGRRRIIADEEDDEVYDGPSLSKVANKAQVEPQGPVSSGLVVKVEEKKENSGNSANRTQMTSVNEIKQTMGVDIQALATSREVVEAEEVGAKVAASLVDDYGEFGPMGTHEVEGGIEEAERKVRRLSQALRKAVRRDTDVYEVWDTRELLREAMMEAGNLCLENFSVACNELSPEELLRKAVNFFSKAQILVSEQSHLHKTMSNEAKETRCLLRRNLKLLLGQAHANGGIARIELARLLSHQDHEKKLLFRESRHEFRSSLDAVNAIRRLVERDERENCNDILDSTLDKLQAIELEALVWRWNGALYWLQGMRKEAIRYFQLAIAASKTVTLENFADAFEDDFFQLRLRILTQSYHAATILADFAVDELRDAPIAAVRKDPSRFEVSLSTASEAIEAAAEISATLSQRDDASTNQLSDMALIDMFNQHGILRKDDLQKSLAEVKEWWQRKKVASLRELRSNESEKDRPHRSDLPHGEGFGPNQDSAPTRRFVVVGSSGRGRKRRKLQDSVIYNNICRSTKDSGDVEVTAEETERRQYRKWGDELLNTGTAPDGSVQLTYPSVAPEMPPEIRALFGNKL